MRDHKDPTWFQLIAGLMLQAADIAGIFLDIHLAGVEASPYQREHQKGSFDGHSAFSESGSEAPSDSFAV